ncbi:hypothetical protein H257_16132 [Aphanomyces astaci]|uniref:Uncharacterized protein n=2 Tax=Aphanomyces astaci TaxID=112090 RepID=W4FLK2_APHAT|nr:hypothetical protein H257_16132 [Aphanomyces astaci]ETV67776.1 hypothetical protein H257_16132 [Aphanomyces astaci]KAF0701844.1 hypothetical protein AaE_016289 [Aphanomyces astaci]RHX99542.1 hypothetical protein DYB36_010703 [Aphanomyces astaci]RHY14648.1 hypothetical protein DYB25_007385 [Aphanomyces astaci]RHY39204.1 hypothetical protein DYB30_008916 [Aphanomyces astaci]|eukprot:XP_009842769.1 hypothetical protein H257_16132 [Aphanomyces astaci]
MTTTPSTTAAATTAVINANIECMNLLQGYDVVIVCCSTPMQAQYWQNRLMATRGEISPENMKVIAVYEDWVGGAGNGLGTLYAYQKAVAEGKAVYGADFDLTEQLKAGTVSVALYHTAGKGTRLAPLPGSENNNKPGVKLPAMLTIDDKVVPMTILEAVIKQTGVYAASRRGRLSVYWGDQVFIPSAPVQYTPVHHIDILATLAPMPTEAEWKAKGLDKYGLIAVNDDNQAAQVDKVSHATARRLLSDFGHLKSVGTSLGSFSVDHDILIALLGEFDAELQQKTAKLDTDPHFWMPFTLPKQSYIELMVQKGVQQAFATVHYERMQALLHRFYSTRREKLGLFGCVDVGSAAYWWDYGQLKYYLKNNVLVTEDSTEATALRLFLGISNPLMWSELGPGMVFDQVAVLGSKITKGTIRRSVLSGVTATSVTIEDSILINVTAHSISAKQCVLYNVTSEDLKGLQLDAGSVVVGVHLPNGDKLVVESHLNICGGDAWKVILDQNEHSFEQIYHLNEEADVAEIEKLVRDEHMRVRELIHPTN